MFLPSVQLQYLLQLLLLCACQAGGELDLYADDEVAAI